ncbi:hypothetical protein [Devosia sp. CN2-171]|uniref:hypothetical protein n=1 Tax=Devosia sp. CN2-171 TaxID=3400909 RepID=UPI003BF8937A
MARFEIVNRIARYNTTFMGAEPDLEPGFLGWIELIRPNGDPAGYIYLEDKAKGSRLGGVGRFDPPYVVMSRPIREAALLFTVLDSNRPLQLRYHGEEERGGSTFLEEDFTTQTEEIRQDIESEVGRALFTR